MMASSIAYVFVLVLMVCGAMGLDNGNRKWRKGRRCLQITDYDRLIEKQTKFELTLDQKIASLKDSSLEQSDLIQDLNNKLKAIQETVVFSASVTDKTTYQAGEIYLFTNTLVNVGDGYNSSTGYFTAPIAGTYMFTVQVCNVYYKQAVFYLKVANETILSTTHEGMNAAGACASYTGTGIMQAGEKAWVECSWESRNFANDDYRWNMFSGVRL